MSVREIASQPGQVRSRLGSATRAISTGFIDLLAPPQCGNCGCEVETGLGEAMLCLQCLEDLSVGSRLRRCVRCAMPLPVELAHRCPHCSKKRLRHDEIWTWGTYDAALRRALLHIKNPGHDVLTDSLASLFWAQNGDKINASAFDAIVPIPLHWARRFARGTNSAEVLAECLGRRSRVTVVSRMLARRRKTIPQSGLTQRQRRINIRGALATRRGYVLDAARILLVDDIYTSGATCGEAARVLKAAGAAQVGIAVIARADAPN